LLDGCEHVPASGAQNLARHFFFRIKPHYGNPACEGGSIWNVKYCLLWGDDWNGLAKQRLAVERGRVPVLEQFLCQRFFAGRIISQGEAAQGGSQFGRSSQANLVPNKFCWSRNFSRSGDGGP
jgi:hypothetical protein